MTIATDTPVRATWARYKEPGTGESYMPTWVVAVPATHKPLAGRPVSVVSRSGRVKSVYVHEQTLEERVINGVPHRLHRIDNDPFGVGGDDWDLDGMDFDVGDK